MRPNVVLLCGLALLLLNIEITKAEPQQKRFDPTKQCKEYIPPPSVGNTPSNPLLLIPGVAGSILMASKTDDPSFQKKIWVSLGEVSIKHYWKLWMGSKYDNQSNWTNLKNTLYELNTPLNTFGLCAIDDLDPDLVVKAGSAYYYRNMILYLVNKLGYESGKTLFGFPYDWRQSNANERQLMSLRLQVIQAFNSSNKRIDVISHSMGGVLFRSFLAKYPDDLKYIRSWISIATPFQGASLPTQGLLSGYNIAGSIAVLSNYDAHNLMLQYPSSYELLASPTFLWGVRDNTSSNFPDKPQLIINMKDKVGNITSKNYGPDELINVLQKANRNNLYFGDSNPLDLSIWNASQQARQLWESFNESFPRASDLKFFVIAGKALPTAFDLVYNIKEGPDNDPLGGLLHSSPSYVFTPGDGTVPFPSAYKGAPLTPKCSVVLTDPSYDHVSLLGSPQTLSAVTNWLLGMNSSTGSCQGFSWM